MSSLCAGDDSEQDDAGGTEMFVTDGSSELLSSKCCFFLRNAKEGASLDTARYPTSWILCSEGAAAVEARACTQDPTVLRLETTKLVCFENLPSYGDAWREDLQLCVEL